MKSGSWRTPVCIFIAAACVLLALCGHRFVLTNDEGIILESAQRMAQGARPYADFFGYMSPGSYWLQAGIFRVVGVSYLAGKLPVIFGLALQCALLFWLTARLSSRRAGFAALVIFAGFQMADPGFLTAQHRWDSATLALAGLCCAIAYASPVAKTVHANWGLVISGALMGAAAWCTPSIALTGIVVGAWLLASGERRSLTIPYVAGITAVTAAAVGRLAMDGILWDFLRQMQWLQKNYSGVNVMAYGSVIGGYGKLFEGGTAGELPVRAILVLCVALPAIVPLAAALVWLFAFVRGQALFRAEPAVQLLLAATVTLIASTYPRSDLMHLAFVAAVPYALAAAGLARTMKPRPGAFLAFTLIPLSLLFSFNNVLGWFSSQPVNSPMGRILAPPDVAPDMEKLVTHVRPGQTLFVYPYLPVEYFLTQGRNPTRFPYLGPGMMTSEDEQVVLSELQAAPPQWLLYLDLKDDELLRVFPSATGRDPRFRKLENWFKENYSNDDEAGVNVRGYRLWRRTNAEAASSRPSQSSAVQ